LAVLTKKGKYGLKAMVELGRLPEGRTMLLTDIADANDIPKPFLEIILGELRRPASSAARRAAAAAMHWRGRRPRSMSATSCAHSTARSRRSPAPAAPSTSAATTAPTRRPAPCGA
jgi:hypothetical protein